MVKLTKWRGGLNSMKKPNEVLLTQKGLEELKSELKGLTEVQRPEILDALRTAKSMGDLSENGMYSAAREKQSFLEGRIRELEDLLKRAKVVEDSGSNKIINLGSNVKLEANGVQVVYSIVGATEVDTLAKKISHESPLGQALMGKKLGDEVEFIAPVGTVKYKIIEIK